MEHGTEGCMGDRPRSAGFDALEWRGKSMTWTKCKGNLTDLRRELHLSLAKGNPK
jgi:hypothetical protein